LAPATARVPTLAKTGPEQTTDVVSKIVTPCSHLFLYTQESTEAKVLVSTHADFAPIAPITNAHGEADGNPCRGSDQAAHETYGPTHTHLTGDLHAALTSYRLAPNGRQGVMSGLKTFLS